MARTPRPVRVHPEAQSDEEAGAELQAAALEHGNGGGEAAEEVLAVAHTREHLPVDKTAAIYAAFGAQQFATYAKGKAIEALFADDIGAAITWLTEADERLRNE